MQEMMTSTFLDFQAAAQKRQIAQKEDAGCCVSVRVTAADAHTWLRTIEKRRLHSGKGFRTQGLSEPLVVISVRHTSEE